VGEFTRHLTKMINVRGDLPTEIDAMVRLGAEEGFRCLAVAELDETTTAITGFTLWLCSHERPSMNQPDYNIDSRRYKHTLKMERVIGEGLSVWKLRRLQASIKARTSNRIRPGDKLQLTIWCGEPHDRDKHGQQNYLKDQDAWLVLVTAPDEAEALWVLTPIHPDARRSGL
jgi:hypothetical protein